MSNSKNKKNNIATTIIICLFVFFLVFSIYSSFALSTPLIFIYYCVIAILTYFKKTYIILPLTFVFSSLISITSEYMDSVVLLFTINILYYGIFAFEKIFDKNANKEEKRKNNFYLFVYSSTTILLLLIEWKFFPELLLLFKIFLVIICFIGFVAQMYDAIIDEYRNGLNYLFCNHIYYLINLILSTIACILQYEYISIYYLIYCTMYLFPYNIITSSNPGNIKNVRNLKNKLQQI